MFLGRLYSIVRFLLDLLVLRRKTNAALETHTALRHQLRVIERQVRLTNSGSGAVGDSAVSFLFSVEGIRLLVHRRLHGTVLSLNQRAAILCRQWEKRRDTGDCLLPA